VAGAAGGKFSCPVRQPASRSVTGALSNSAPVAAVVIWSPNPSVFAVRAAGVLCAFYCVLDALPGQCLRRRPVQVPLSLLFLELSGYCVNAVRATR
jgi:hypothetical protein